MKKKTKIVFIVGALSQPRCIKRISSIANSGFECVVYGFDRGIYNCNVYPDNIKINVLGTLPSGGGYLSKFKTYKKEVYRIIEENVKENVIFYGFGMLPVVWLYLKKVRYIREISDILYAYPSYKLIEPIIRKFDKKMIRRSLLTIMTSEGFRKYYGINNTNIIVQPNKVNSVLLNTERLPLPNTCGKHLVFAYVGAIRYDTIFRFAETIGKFYPQHEYHFYGETYKANMDIVNNLVTKYPNVKKFGAFKNPDDLPVIYKNIDIITACYSVSSVNERIAEPNKLYEALFFCKPILVSDGIFLSEQVKKYKCGYCLDASTENSIRIFIDSLDGEKLAEISQREYNIDALSLVDDAWQIIERINNIVDK